MNQLNKDKLQSLLHDELAFNSVKMVFDKVMAQKIPTIDSTNDNRVLGEKYRAYIMAKELINLCFEELLSYKAQIKEKRSFNKGL